MNSKLLLIIIVLIVVFGAFTFLGNKKTNPATSTQPTTKPTVTEANNLIATVVLTDTGFIPKDITVKVGTKVVWVNKSGKTATVDSADHPTHRLNTFLNLGAFSDGAIVQTVFDKAGKYNYHNHLNSSETGAVIVE